MRHSIAWLAGALAVLGALGCARANQKPNCERMRACCASLADKAEALPPEHELLCHHDPELDEGCVDTLVDIARFTPAKSLPAVCSLGAR